ncbi:unnamed protein product [Eruca vesicaria subsp. sativa]|uniref:Uncharacterized protein n=1 Tax=Eruca vesicaria subsp. sativa TaxID=29727 RepID=A0ABC8LSE4_ERUVS|nr:unnamed protein product [Eruca vesicaria subsp. sativa]
MQNKRFCIVSPRLVTEYTVRLHPETGLSRRSCDAVDLRLSLDAGRVSSLEEARRHGTGA